MDRICEGLRKEYREEDDGKEYWEEDSDKVHEACGVFGIYGPEGTHAAEEIYYGLMALQHRGQESAGISVSDTGGPKGNYCIKKGMGLVSEVFSKENLRQFTGNLGVGHVR